MNLGEYIARLERENPDKKVPMGLGKPHSWRGSYDELSFEPVKDTTVGEMLADARSAVGKTFIGWKGGEYTMTEFTRINVDFRGKWSDGSQLLEMLLDLLFSDNEQGHRSCDESSSDTP